MTRVSYSAFSWMRPVYSLKQGDTVITMSFDRLGRRVDYQETQDDQVSTHFRFVYDNFLCVQRLNAANGNAVRTEFVWDPTEPIATRPLVMRAKNWGLNLFYTHDGNKNVSEVFYHAPQNGIAAHYDYAPFGAVTRTFNATRVSNRDILSENPFRFSSEYHDAPLGLIYYNYRHYHSSYGRWIRRDKIGSYGGLNEYAYMENMSGLYSDFLGMAVFYYDAAGMNYNRIFEKTQKNVKSFLEKLECISDEAFTQLVKDGKVKLDGESFTGSKEDFIQEVKHEAQSQQLSGQGLTFNAFKEDVRAKFQENIKSNNDVFIVGMHGTIENNPKPRHAQLMFTDCMIDTAKVEDFLKGLPNSGGRIELISCGRTFPPDYSNEQIGDCYNEGLWLIPASGKVDVMKCDISFSRMKARRIYGKGGKDAKMDLL